MYILAPDYWFENLSFNIYRYEEALHCFADSVRLSLQCVPAAAPSHRCAHHTAALWPHEAEVQRVRPGTDAAELEVLDRILVNVNVVNQNITLPQNTISFLVCIKHYKPSVPVWGSTVWFITLQLLAAASTGFLRLWKSIKFVLFSKLFKKKKSKLTNWTKHYASLEGHRVTVIQHF